MKSTRELIHEYLNDTLDAEGFIELENRLAGDPAAADLLVGMSAHAARVMDCLSGAASLRALPKRPRIRRRIMLAAAAALVLVPLAGLLFLGKATIPPVARVDGLKAQVLVLPDRTPVVEGQRILSGQGLETAGPGSAVTVIFPDGTRIRIGAGSILPTIDQGESGKRITLTKGSILADIARQPAGRPMVFATPQGEARVLGTKLRIATDSDPKKGTRLEVEEGKVELRNLAGRMAIVESGHYAVVATGVELAAKPLATPLSTLAKLRPNTWVEVEASYSVPPSGGSHTPVGWTKMVYDSVSGRVLIFDRWSDPVRLDTSYANAVIEFFPATGYASLVRVGNWRKEPSPGGHQTVPLPENGLDPTPCDRMTHGGVAFVPFQNALYLANGANQTAPNAHNSARDTWRLDLATKRWTRVPSLVQPPNELEDCMTYDEGEGKLVYFAHAAANEPQTWVMDPGKGQWSRIELATQPPGRFGGAMAYDPVRKRSLLFGGGPYPKPGRDLWAYDARTSVWTRLVDAPFEVKNAGFAYDSRHDIFMASAQGGGVPNRTLVYSPAANAWSEVLPAPGDSWPEWSGTSQAMAFDPANDVFVFLREGLGVPRWFVFRYAR